MNISLGDKQLYWVLFVLLFLLAFYGVTSYFIDRSKGNEEILIDKAEARMFEARAIYSPNCFAYEDVNTQRVYSGTIDLDKFNKDSLNSCTNLLSGSDRGIVLSLHYIDSNGKKNTEAINTKSYEIKQARTSTRLNSYPVFVKDNGPGTLRIMHVE